MGKRGVAAAADSKKVAKAKVVAGPLEPGSSALPEATALLGAHKQVLAITGKALQSHLERARVVHETCNVEVTAAPQSLGALPAFNEGAALKALHNGKYYMCCINLAWLDMSFCPCPAVPISENAVNRIFDHYFKEGPAGLESQGVTVCILQAELDAGKFPAPGTWKHTSAEESIVAFYLAAHKTAKLVQGGATDEQPRMDAWRECILSCPVTIKVCETVADMEWQAAQIREDLSTQSYLARSPVQRIYDVQAKKEQMGTGYTPQGLIDLYSSKVKFSAKSEKLTTNFLNQSQFVYERALQNPKIVDILLADEAEDSPLWASVSAIYYCLTKTALDDELTFIFQFIADQKKAGFLKETSLTSRFLTGTTATHNKGYADLILYKYRLKGYLTSEYLTSDLNNLPEKFKQKLREVFGSVEVFRQHLGFPDKRADLTWKCGWSASADLALNAFEDVIFTPKYDESLRNGCRAGKVPTDLLSMDTALAALFAEVKTKLSQDILDSRPDQGSEESAPAPAPAESSSPSCSEALTQFMETVRARCGENTNQETLELMQSCEAKARSLFNSNVSLHVCPGSERELLELLKSSKVAQIRGDKQAWVGIFVDNCQWGEPITNPHVRTAPLNLSYLKTFVNAVIASRDPQCLTLHTRDLYMFFDGFQHHQLTKMLGAVQSATGSSLTKNSFQVNLSYDEESLRKRRAYVKVQSTVFDQIEQMALVTSEPFQESMSYRARAHFKGTSVGNKIGDIHVDAPGTLWSLTMKEKLDLYGKYRVPVGGRTPGSDPTENHRGQVNKSKATLDPVFWHARPQLLYQELLKSYNLCAVLDGGCADGQCATTRALMRIPYFGLCLTPEHLDKVTERIVATLLSHMMQSDSPIFEPKLAAAVGGGVAAAGSQTTTTPSGGPSAGGTGQGGAPKPGTAQSVLDDFQAQLAALTGAGGGKNAS